jgi:hypothetical protein
VPGMSKALLARDTANYVLEVVRVLRARYPDICQPSKLDEADANDVNPKDVDPDSVAEAITQGYWKDPFYVVR